MISSLPKATKKPTLTKVVASVRREVALRAAPDLEDAVEDRARGEGEEGELQRLRLHPVAERGAHEQRGRRRPGRRARASARTGGVSASSGPMMPKPSVALWRAKPTISVVASATSPAWAETPMARPSLKLCTPMAIAISIPMRSALGTGRASVASGEPLEHERLRSAGDRRGRAAEHPALEGAQAHQAGAEADDGHRQQPGEAAPGGLARLRLLERPLDDLVASARRRRRSRKASTPAEAMHAARRVPLATWRRRASGSPRKIVKPGDGAEEEGLLVGHTGPLGLGGE